MKFPFLLTLLSVVAIIACQPRTASENESTNSDSTVQSAPPAPMPGATCYQGIMKQDTFRLQVVLANGSATGTLAYRFKEKDSSHGNLTGVMSGDTLFAIFDYAAEGRRSKREVAFLLSPTEAQEGYGTLEEQGDVMRFSSRKDIQFNGLMRMQHIDCAAQPFDGLRESE